MARNYSVQGALSGRLGNMIGYRMFGHNYVRSMPSHYHDRRSESQLVQRSLFKSMIQTAQLANSALRIGLRKQAADMHMTPGNAFLKINHANFIYNNGIVDVDYPKLVISSGSVGTVAFGKPSLHEDNIISIDFEKNMMLPLTANDDHVHIFIYSPALRTGGLIAEVSRKTKHIKFALPEYYLSEETHIYGFVEGTSGECSASTYIGSVNPSSLPLPVIAKVKDDNTELNNNYDSNLTNTNNTSKTVSAASRTAPASDTPPAVTQLLLPGLFDPPLE